jgi:hypothetical protein
MARKAHRSSFPEDRPMDAFSAAILSRRVGRCDDVIDPQG